MKTLTDIFLEKSSHLYWDRKKVQVYKDNPENRRLHRVGQPYTRGKGDPEEVEDRTEYSVRRPDEDTIRNIDSRSRFGQNHTEYKDAPREAIERLFRDKSGQIEAAFNVYLPTLVAKVSKDKQGRKKKNSDGTSLVKFDTVKNSDGTNRMTKYPVDLVWGYKDEETGKDNGLLHAHRRHIVEQNDYASPKELTDAVISAMSELKKPDSRKKFTVSGDRVSFLDSKGNRIVLKIEVNRDANNRRMFRLFLHTSYDETRPMEQKERQ